MPDDTRLSRCFGSRAVVIAGLAARPLLSISAFRAKFGLGVIWLSAVRWDFTCLTPSEPYRFLAQAICLPAFTDRAMEAWYHSLLHE
jgi:hypothetical protein